MTDEQLDVARAHADAYTVKLGYKSSNMTFVKGHIEVRPPGGGSSMRGEGLCGVGVGTRVAATWSFKTVWNRSW